MGGHTVRWDVIQEISDVTNIYLFFRKGRFFVIRSVALP